MREQSGGPKNGNPHLFSAPAMSPRWLPPHSQSVLNARPALHSSSRPLILETARWTQHHTPQPWHTPWALCSRCSAVAWLSPQQSDIVRSRRQRRPRFSDQRQQGRPAAQAAAARQRGGGHRSTTACRGTASNQSNSTPPVNWHTRPKHCQHGRGAAPAQPPPPAHRAARQLGRHSGALRRADAASGVSLYRRRLGSHTHPAGLHHPLPRSGAGPERPHRRHRRWDECGGVRADWFAGPLPQPASLPCLSWQHPSSCVQATSCTGGAWWA
jgi:hypothetical protein